MFCTFRIDIDSGFLDLLEAKLWSENKDIAYFPVVRIGNRFNVGGVGSFVSKKLHGVARKTKYFTMIAKIIRGRFSAQLVGYCPPFSEKEKKLKIIGLDIGINNILVTSAADYYQLPFGIKLNINKLYRLKRKLKCKQKGSKNYVDVLEKINETRQNIKDGIKNEISRIISDLKKKHKRRDHSLVFVIEIPTKKPNYIIKYIYDCVKRACNKRKIPVIDISPALQKLPDKLSTPPQYERDVYAAIKIAKSIAEKLEQNNDTEK